MGTETTDTMTSVRPPGLDPRLRVCRCAPTVDAFIVVTARYVVLVDTLINPATASEMLAMAREHLAGGRRLLAVNTHADWDHCWGNQLFAGPDAVEAAPIIASRLGARRLASAEAAATLKEKRAAEPERFGGVRLTPPTLLFDERLVIDGGDLTLELFATPGHEPDHVAVHIPAIRTLLAGDAAESPFPFVRSAADLPAARESLARMAALNPETALYCHAPETSGPALLRWNIDYFNRLEDRCWEALANGAPPSPAADADLEAMVGFPFREAVPPGLDPEELAGFYRPGHLAHIRAMLELLGSGGAAGGTGA